MVSCPHDVAEVFAQIIAILSCKKSASKIEKKNNLFTVLFRVSIISYRHWKRKEKKKNSSKYLFFTHVKCHMCVCIYICVYI